MSTTLLIPIIVTIALLIVGAILFLTKSSSGPIKSRGSTILLSGEMSSGKTALFYYLKTGQFVDSVTSIQPNQGTFPLVGFDKSTKQGQTTQTVYDLPGHGTFKSVLPKVLPETKTLFFLIDSNVTSFSQSAQSLYSYLTNKYISLANIPIIIICTKIDQPGSTPMKMIQKKLQDEIEIIRKAHSGLKQLDAVGTDNDGNNGKEDLYNTTIPLTDNDQPFSFEKIREDIKWVNISVKNKNIDSLAQFI